METHSYYDSPSIICSLLHPQVVIVLALVCAAFARPDGSSSSRESYSFDWAVQAEDSNENELNFGHSQSYSSGEDTKGSYYVLLPDTRLMKVEYYVDATGYHPTVTFEGSAEFDSSESK